MATTGTASRVSPSNKTTAEICVEEIPIGMDGAVSLNTRILSSEGLLKVPAALTDIIGMESSVFNFNRIQAAPTVTTGLVYAVSLINGILGRISGRIIIIMSLVL